MAREPAPDPPAVDSSRPPADDCTSPAFFRPRPTRCGPAFPTQEDA